MRLSPLLAAIGLSLGFTALRASAQTAPGIFSPPQTWALATSPGVSINRQATLGYHTVLVGHVYVENNFGWEELHALAFRVDGHGDLVWARQYRLSWNQTLLVAVASHGSLYTAGWVGDQGLLLNMSPDGFVSWHRVIGHEGICHATGLVPTMDGGAAVAVSDVDSYVDADSGHTIVTARGRPLVFKFDAHGNLQWQRLLGREKVFDYAEVTQTTDGDIVVGASYSLDSGIRDTEIVRLRVTDGSTIWKKSIKDVYMLRAICADRAGGAVILAGDGGGVVCPASNGIGVFPRCG